MKISCEELYIVWEAWNKGDNPLDNPFEIESDGLFVLNGYW